MEELEGRTRGGRKECTCGNNGGGNDGDDDGDGGGEEDK